MRVQQWAIAAGMVSMEDVAFAFTTKEEADGALGEKGSELWTNARCGRVDSLLAKAAMVRASGALSGVQADQHAVVASAWQRRSLRGWRRQRGR